MIFAVLFSLIIGVTPQQPTYPVGEYYFEKTSQKFYLNLKEDGTFLFSHYWNTAGLDAVGSEHAQGKWELKNNKIGFFSDPKKDIDQNHRLNFQNTQVVIDKNSTLTFVGSQIFWLNNLTLEKKV
jgi:hypothetical protein